MNTFEFFFPALRHGGMASVVLEQQEGKPLKMYLDEPPLSEFHLKAIRMRCKLLNQDRQRLRLNHIPEPGEQIVMTPVKKAAT